MMDKNELFENERLEEDSLSLRKGMRPMPSAQAINFLSWLQAAHPEIARIRDIPAHQWQQIAEETGIPVRVLTTSMSALQDKSFHHDGYDEVRTIQRSLGL